MSARLHHLSWLEIAGCAVAAPSVNAFHFPVGRLASRSLSPGVRAGVRCGCTLRQRLLPGFGCLVCGSLISDVRLTCSTRKVQGSRQKVAQVFGRHVACNPDAFCWLAVPVASGQPVVANAVTAPLSCEGWLTCSAFLWQCQLMPSAPAGALCI